MKQRINPEGVIRWGPDESEQEHLDGELSLVCWNVAKKKKARRSLENFVASADIVCTQEFVPNILAPSTHSGVFAPSYQRPFGRGSTGVSTLSKKPAIDSWALTAPRREALAFTPKMTLFTKHVMGDETLLVANLHGLNFQFSLTNMLQKQLEEVAQLVDDHTGPVVVCGDFNTWHVRRLQVLHSVLDGIETVEFPEGRAGGSKVVRLLGGDPTLPLDHVFFRGLSVIAPPTVHHDKASDHAALHVKLGKTGD